MSTLIENRAKITQILADIEQLPEDRYYEGKEEGRAEGYEQGVTEGYQSGYTKGNEDGYATGRVEGESIGFADALAKRTELLVEEAGEYVPEGESTGFKKVTVGIQKGEDLDAVIAEQAELIGELSATLDEKIGAYDVGYDAALEKLTDLVVTENGDYAPEGDSTGFRSVSVAITKLPEIERKTVSFVDYDGTILYTYSSDEFKKMTEMPPLPSHDGLICQGWNWTLDEIKQYIADFEEDNRHLYPFDVGAIYITDDGKSRFVINIDDEDGVGGDITFQFSGSNYYYIYVDWGDGAGEQRYQKAGAGQITHNYVKSGRYTITVRHDKQITLENGSTGIFHNNINAGVLEEVYLGEEDTVWSGMFYGQSFLKILTIPNHITAIGDSAFSGCCNLENVNLPRGITTLGKNVFTGTGIKRITLPSELQTAGLYTFANSNSMYAFGRVEHATFRSPLIPDNSFQYVKTFKEMNLAKSTSVVPYGAFQYTHSMRRFYAPPALASIERYGLYETYCRVYDFSACRQIPTLESQGIETSRAVEIRVPLHMLEEWKAATNWSSHADKMVGKEVAWSNEIVEEAT